MLQNWATIFKGKIKDLAQGKGRTAAAGRQIALSFIMQGVSILVSLLYVPLLLNYLSQEKYGIWLTLTSIIAWFAYFDIGLGNGMRNKLTEALANDNKILANTYVSTTYALLSMIFIGLLIIFLIANPFINWNSVLNSPSIDSRELTLLAGITFSLFILRFIVQLVGVIYLADQQPAINNTINALAGLFSLAGIYMLMRASTKGDLVLLGALVSAMPVILFILLSVIAFSGKYEYLKPRWGRIDFSSSRELLTLGGKFFLLQVTAVVMYSTSSFFISLYHGPEEVVVYNLAFKYFQMPVLIYTIILSPLWSSVTSAWVKDDFNWLRKTMKRLNYVSAGFIVLIVLMVFLADDVYRIWVGNKVSVPLYLNILMAIYSGINILIAPYWNFINGTGRLKLTMIFNLLGACIYFFLVFTFSGYYPDSRGIVIATIVPLIIFALIQPLQTYKLLSRKGKGIFIE
jgi:O-antigen/teichoic acid export membrane protein